MSNTRKTLAVVLLLVVAFSLIDCTGSRTRKSAGEFIDDAWITTKVKSKMLADDGLSIFEIEVDTFKGTVKLSGFVNKQRQINRAIEIARSVKGVKKVINSLTVK